MFDKIDKFRYRKLNDIDTWIDIVGHYYSIYGRQCINN